MHGNPYIQVLLYLQLTAYGNFLLLCLLFSVTCVVSTIIVRRASITPLPPGRSTTTGLVSEISVLREESRRYFLTSVSLSRHY
jgi:hypothetical protein